MALQALALVLVLWELALQVRCMLLPYRYVIFVLRRHLVLIQRPRLPSRLGLVELGREMYLESEDLVSAGPAMHVSKKRPT